MEFDPNKDEVIKLLTKLKTSTNGAYPPELLVARKAHYLQQVAQIGLAAGGGMGIKQILKAGKGPGIPPAIGTFLEAVLVVAIVGEAATLGYFYKDKLAALLNNSLGKPKIEESSDPPAVNSPVPQIQSTASPIMTTTQTPIGTPSPIIVINGTPISATEVVNPVNPVPVATDKNGNQYGLTPKPERTKDPNGDDGSTDGNTNKDSNKNKP